LFDQRKRASVWALASKQLLGFGFVALIFLAFACSSSKGSKQTFDPQKADAEAHAALIKDTELSGSGWKTTQDDAFNDDELPSTAACQDLKSLQATAEKTRTARARREFERTASGSQVPLSVAENFHIYDQDSRVQSLLKQFKALEENGKATPCLTAFFQDQLKSAGGSVSVKDASPVGKAPSGGIALAYDLTVGPFNFRAENYEWTLGNGVMETTFTGTKDAITSDLVSSTNQKVSDAADQVAKGTRTK
jgi:hypothetical protein